MANPPADDPNGKKNGKANPAFVATPSKAATKQNNLAGSAAVTRPTAFLPPGSVKKLMFACEWYFKSDSVRTLQRQLLGEFGEQVWQLSFDLPPSPFRCTLPLLLWASSAQSLCMDETSRLAFGMFILGGEAFCLLHTAANIRVRLRRVRLPMVHTMSSYQGRGNHGQVHQNC
jgi:hypothetical protein